MAALIVGALAIAGGGLVHALASASRRKKTRECHAIAAAAFSAIFGVRIICEEEAKVEIIKGNPDVKRLEIKDLFKVIPKDLNRHNSPLYYIPDSAYDPQYDYDFSNHYSLAEKCTRGGYPYKRPSGWNRKAVRVIGKYEDNVWLGKKGWRDESSPGEWWVSYHGTKRENVPGIVANGYDPGKSKRQKYGEGIYSTPDIKVAEYYATEFNYKGKSYKCILQNRVNPKNTETIESDMRKWDYFVTPDKDDIRPYGICLKELELKSRS